MSKPLKIVLLVVAFAVAASAGAYRASRSNPFPPGVEDPGARPDPTPSGSAAPTSFALAMDADTEHLLHQGGACRSDWSVTGSVTAASGGELTGQAIARLVPPAGCDFAQAQVQTKRIWLAVTGTLSGRRARLTFRETQRSPVGSQDLGGFAATLRLIKPVVRLAGGAGSASVEVSVPDGDQGTYRSDNVVQLQMQ